MFDVLGVAMDLKLKQKKNPTCFRVGIITYATKPLPVIRRFLQSHAHGSQRNNLLMYNREACTINCWFFSSFFLGKTDQFFEVF
jgi:hypothetical protein